MSKQKVWLGIDPGKSGGVSWVNEDCSEYNCYYTPENISGMAELLKDLHLEYNIVRVTIEKIDCIPLISKSSMSVLSENCGQWQMAAVMLGIPLYHVKPKKWQNGYFGVKDKGVKRDTKKLSREHASQMFPNHSFKKKKDDGKSDSILICKYGKDNF